MGEPSSRYAPGGRARGARRSWRDGGRDAPPSHAVKRGTGTIRTCTGCGQSVETIEIGTGAWDIDDSTYRCALCLLDAEELPETPVERVEQVGPPEALRVLQRHLEPVAEKPPLDLVALMGGPEGRPVVAAPPVELLPARPAAPEAAEDENGEADDALAHAVRTAFGRRPS